MDNETEVEQGPVAVLTGLGNSGKPFTNVVDLNETGGKFLRGYLSVGNETDATITSIELLVNGEWFKATVMEHVRRADSVEILFSPLSEKLSLWWVYESTSGITSYESKIDVTKQ